MNTRHALPVPFAIPGLDHPGSGRCVAGSTTLRAFGNALTVRRGVHGVKSSLIAGDLLRRQKEIGAKSRRGRVVAAAPSHQSPAGRSLCGISSTEWAWCLGRSQDGYKIDEAAEWPSHKVNLHETPARFSSTRGAEPPLVQALDSRAFGRLVRRPLWARSAPSNNCPRSTRSCIHVDAHGMGPGSTPGGGANLSAKRFDATPEQKARDVRRGRNFIVDRGATHAPGGVYTWRGCGPLSNKAGAAARKDVLSLGVRSQRINHRAGPEQAMSTQPGCKHRRRLAGIKPGSLQPLSTEE